MLKTIIASAFAIIVALPASAGKVVTETVSSKVLGEDVTYNVYLPDGYDSGKHYPVIYLLHGLSSTRISQRQPSLTTTR